MLRKIVKYACAAAVVGLLGSAAQASTVVTWNGSDQFNDYQMNFSGFTANQLTSIAGTGTYEAAPDTSSYFFWCGCYLSGTNTTFSLSIDLNGSWTVLKTWSTSSLNESDLSSLLTPISFAQGTVTGIWLQSNPNGPNDDPNYESFNLNRSHGADDYETFTFDNKVTVTPLPAALPLFAGGVGFLGFLARRRKQKA